MLLLEQATAVMRSNDVRGLNLDNRFCGCVETIALDAMRGQ